MPSSSARRSKSRLLSPRRTVERSTRATASATASTTRKTSAPGRKFPTASTMRVFASLSARSNCSTMALLLFLSSRAKPLRPAPAGDQIRLLRFERHGQIFDALIRCRRAEITNLKGERRPPSRIQGHERSQQVVARQDPEPVSQREVVDDARPHIVVEPELGHGTVGELAQVDDGPRREDPCPDVSELPVGQAKGLDQPLDIRTCCLPRPRDGRCSELL